MAERPKLDIVVTDSDIRKYFSDMEWKEMSAYEKEQTRNILRNHLVMISCGFKTPLPCFITNFEARQLNNLASIEPCEDNPSGSKQNRKGYPGHVLSSKGEVPLKKGSGATRQSTRVPKPKQSVKIVRPDREGLPKRGPGRPRKSGAKTPSSKPTKSIEPCEDNPSGSKQNRKGYPGHVLSSKGEVPLKKDSGAPRQSTRVPKPKQSVKIVRPDREGLTKRDPGRPRKSGAKTPSSKPTKRPIQDVQGKTRNQPPRRSKSKCRVFIKSNFQSNRKQRKR